VFGKKSLKISKMFTKAVNGRIDNTMTNKTYIKELQTTTQWPEHILKAKKSSDTNPTKNRGLTLLAAVVLI
jgi:hypothetical protein